MHFRNEGRSEEWAAIGISEGGRGHGEERAVTIAIRPATEGLIFTGGSEVDPVDKGNGAGAIGFDEPNIVAFHTAQAKGPA